MIRRLVLFVLVFVIIGSRYCFSADGYLSVSPPFIDISLNEIDATKNYDITLTNTSSDSVSIELSPIDFSANQNYTGVVFHGLNGQENYDKKYTLIPWIEFNEKNIELLPQSSRVVRVTIKNNHSLTIGGRYGGVMFSVVKNTPDEKNLSLNQSYTTLFYVKKTGPKAIAPRIVFDKYLYKDNLFKINTQAKVTLKNEGNHHIIPRGIVKIYDIFGNNIYKGVINENSFFLLPETSREFTVDLVKTKQYFLPGFYKIEFSYRYEGIDDFEKKKFRFFYLGKSWLILPIAIFVFFILKRARKFDT